MASREAIMDVLGMFAAVPALYGQPLQSRTPDIYYAALEPIPDDLLRRAAVVVLRDEEQYFPTPGKLFKAATQLADDQPGAVEAWGMVYKSIPFFENLPRRAYKALEAAGGAQTLNDADQIGTSAFRARFIEAYNQITGSQALEVMSLLPGESHLLLESGE